MPRSSASRGLFMATGWPSIRICPSVGWCTPERVLIRVDLPAPLSPKRHMTSPACTFMVTPFSAITEPNRLTMSRSSTSGGAPPLVWLGRSGPGRLACVAMVLPPPRSRAVSAGLGHLAPDVVVEDHGDQQHEPEKDLEPVG